MAVNIVEFQRENLYHEVWAEPVIKVAKRYGLSDVGLRKICKKLRVPLPPMGHWVKVRHGKMPPRPALPTIEGPNSYLLRRYTPEADEELGLRLEAARTVLPDLPTVPRPTWRSTTGDCHPLVKRMSTRLRGAPKDGRGWRAVRGEGLMEVCVSAEQQNRALFLLDAILQCCSSAGFRVVSRNDDSPAHIDVDHEQFTLRITERSRREERKLTPKEEAEKRESPYVYIPDRYVWHSTGELRLEVFKSGTRHAVLSIADGRTRRVDEKVLEIPARLRELAMTGKVERELAAERARQEEILRAERRRLYERRQAELKKLKEVEEAAAQWERAARLRAFASALAAIGSDATEQTAELVPWIRHAADWIDPTVQAHWPDVDDAPAHFW